MSKLPRLSRLTSHLFTRCFTSTTQLRQIPQPSHHSFANALEALDSLKSNRTATSLFSNSSKDTKNAQAIPEMLLWLSRAGYTPQHLAQLQHIHIAGTKGKGSVASYATSLLLESQRNLPIEASDVGTYKSPHLVSPTERICINGSPLDEGSFAEGFWELWNRFTQAAIKEGMPPNEAQGPGSKPFYFRFMTILAWHVFLDQGVKQVVMECGIGGEYDATNVLPKEAVTTSVVTSLGLDHTDMLGNTVEEIAWHKAGIFKKGVTAVCVSDQREGVQKVLRKRATEKGAKFVEIQWDTVKGWCGSSNSISMIARTNQALAVTAVKSHLAKQPGAPTNETLHNTPEWMLEALRKTKLPGVREVIDRGQKEKTTWLLDGAHTKESLDGVGVWVNGLLKPDEQVILIFNQYDRNVKAGLLEFLDAVSRERDQHRSNVFSHILIFDREARPSFDFSGCGVGLKEGERPEFHVCKDVKGAMREAEALAGEVQGKAKVLVTGSFHLVGDVMQEFRSDDRAGWPRDRLGAWSL